MRASSFNYGDLSYSSNLIRIAQETQSEEIYNLGAMRHVAVSFESLEHTADADAICTRRLLEAIRVLGLEKKTRFYQASTSELYGLVRETPQRATTPFYPRSSYAVAKVRVPGRGELSGVIRPVCLQASGSRSQRSADRRRR
jgi:GDPmannose 4,6-dehydratase